MKAAPFSYQRPTALPEALETERGATPLRGIDLA